MHFFVGLFVSVFRCFEKYLYLHLHIFIFAVLYVLKLKLFSVVHCLYFSYLVDGCERPRYNFYLFI